MNTPEINPIERAQTPEAPKVLVDKETGFSRLVYEKGGEVTEVFLHDREGHTVNYINFEAIGKFMDTERALEMMGIKVSASILDLIKNDPAKTKYYIKFLQADDKQQQ